MKHISNYLDEAIKEMFEERAAIIEYDANMSRQEAERLANEEVAAKAAQPMRDDVRAAWKKRRDELAGQA